MRRALAQGRSDLTQDQDKTERRPRARTAWGWVE